MKSPPRSTRKNATTTRTSTKKTRSSRATGSSRRTRSTDPPARAPLAYLGLGSNLGNRRAHLEKALAELARFAPLEKVSSFYRTEPVGFRNQRDFWNAVVEIAWSGSAESLLEAARAVERSVGRTPSFPNGPREIDVDVLDLDGRVREESAPLLPHPRLNGRRFALAPLAEVNPAWRDPRTGKSVKELLEALPPTPRVEKIGRPRLRARAPGR